MPLVGRRRLSGDTTKVVQPWFTIDEQVKPMSVLFDQAIYAVARLPRHRQDVIARRILDAIGADAGWPPDPTTPCSEVALEQLADQARANLARITGLAARSADPVSVGARQLGRQRGG